MKTIEQVISFVKRHPKLAATVLYNKYSRIGYAYWHRTCLEYPKFCAGSILTLILNKKDKANGIQK